MTTKKDVLKVQRNKLMEALTTLRAIQVQTAEAEIAAEIEKAEMDVLSAATRLTQLILKN